MTELARTEPASLAVVQAESNPIAAMLQAIIDKGITAETAATMEKLTDLYIRVEGENARKAFAAAKAALQAELPRVAAQRAIPNRDGTVRSTFAAYEDIMEAVGPMLTKHGFSVSFTVRVEPGPKVDRLCAVCKLQHVGGHAEENEFSVRVSAPPGASEAQGDGATRTYARRGALCDALNIVVSHDTDARAEGGLISPDKAAELEHRILAIKANRAAFLKIAGADDFASIRAGSLGVLERSLAERERAYNVKPRTAGGLTDDDKAEILRREAAEAKGGA